MALPVYPASLPCNLLASDNSSHGESFIRSEFIYAPRQRKTRCAKPVFNFSTNFNQIEYDTFLQFYQVDLLEGSREFAVGWKVHGIISVSKIVRFTAPFTENNLGNGFYRVSASLELLEVT